jgi:DNA-binding MarR family transcriptional regulator
MKEENVKLFREKLREIQRDLGWSQKTDIQCCGITMAQCHALIEIGQRSSVSIVALAGVLGVDTSTLSRTVDNMCKAGLVDRVLNSQDRRYVTLTLTDRGKTVLRTIEESFNGYILKIFQFIEEGKHPQVMESLILIAAAIEKCNSEFPCCAGLTAEK